jgi:hypothetical protein
MFRIAHSSVISLTLAAALFAVVTNLQAGDPPPPPPPAGCARCVYNPSTGQITSTDGWEGGYLQCCSGNCIPV